MKYAVIELHKIFQHFYIFKHSTFRGDYFLYHCIDTSKNISCSQEVLFEAGYVPSNSEQYPVGGITSAIENAFHTTPQLICLKGALEEVRLCFTKDFKVGHVFILY